jgi:hypothetical protein
VERILRFYEFDGSVECGVLRQRQAWLLEKTCGCHGGYPGGVPFLSVGIRPLDGRTLGQANNFSGIQICGHHTLPDVKRQWRWLTAGNIFSVIAIILVSIGFNLFLRYSPTVPQVYTVLAGFVILMTWIYMANLIVLTGVELDTAVKELQKHK